MLGVPRLQRRATPSAHDGINSILCLHARPSASTLQPMRVTMEFTAVLTPAKEGGNVALNPETGTTKPSNRPWPTRGKRPRFFVVARRPSPACAQLFVLVWHKMARTDETRAFHHVAQHLTACRARKPCARPCCLWPVRLGERGHSRGIASV